MTGWTTLVAAPALIRAEGVALFDCRHDLADPAAGERAYRSGHLPGARFLHLDRDLSAPASPAAGRHPLPNRDGLAATLRAAGLRADQQVVAYDDAGGAFAARLWWLLRWLGHERVAVLDGGLPAWTVAGGALAAGAPEPAPPGDFAAGPPLVRVVDADGAAAAPRLLDARAAERFAGQAHPLDPAPGHIPGARSRPFRDNLLPGAALYPGSWSQWAADPTRPVARD